jgi:hypothetical protein
MLHRPNLLNQLLPKPRPQTSTDLHMH